MTRFSGKVALVTGAANGMGAADARAFAQEGAKVIVADISEEGVEVAASIGEAAHYVRLDVTSPESWQAAIAEAETRFGPVGVLVNNAGVFSNERMATVTRESFDRLVGVNQFGVFLGMQQIVGTMGRAGGGAIVNMSSAAALTGTPESPVYGLTKWAVRGMSRGAVKPLARRGIRVNVIYPGMIGGTVMHGQNPTSYNDHVIGMVPLGRAGTPDEVARLVLFLASDDAAYITGAEVGIDGGLMA
jgi:3alpha(or 20beta)-hydroxysteroid dehydrogenase